MRLRAIFDTKYTNLFLRIEFYLVSPGVAARFLRVKGATMTSEDLKNILDDLSDSELRTFQWHLRQPNNVQGLPAIKKRQLETATTCDTVDVMVETYGPWGAVQVTRVVLEKITRNDLLQMLPASSPGPEGAGWLVAEKGSVSPASNASTLDLSYNHPGDSGKETLRAKVDDPDGTLRSQRSWKTLSRGGVPGMTRLACCLRDPDKQKTMDGWMYRISNISSKYKDIVSKSRLLRSGSPSIYQLRPEKKTYGTLTKLTVGERNENNINKTILLVGETGSGKSALINALVNHTMGVKREDEVWFRIVEKKKILTESQTPDVVVYEVFGFEGETLPYSLTIIDTPGFGGTKGIDHDVLVTERLFDLFRSADGVHEISAVGLVMKASDTQVSDRLKYIFNSVMSPFGKNIEKNIVALVTHSDGTNPENVLQALKAAEIKCARNKKNQPVYFLFDNCQHEDQTKKEESGLENAWRVTEKGMSEFMTFLEKTGPQKLNTTVDVMKERERLKACFENLQERIKFIELKQTDIKQNKDVLKKYEKEMKKNENFTVEVTEAYRDKESVSGGRRWFGGYNGALTCRVCQENCHYPGCTVAAKPGHCEIIQSGRCTSCTGKCPTSDHDKAAWKYVTKTRKVKKTLGDMKQNYEENQAGSEEKLSLLESLKTEMVQLEGDKTQFLEEAYQYVVKLNQMALKADSGSTYVQLDFLIEKMKEKGDTKKVQVLKEMKKRQEEGNKEAGQPEEGQ